MSSKYAPKPFTPRHMRCPRCNRKIILAYLGGGCFGTKCRCNLNIRGSVGDGGGTANDAALTLVSYPVDFYGVALAEDLMSEEALEMHRANGAKRVKQKEVTDGLPGHGLGQVSARPGKLFRVAT